MHTWGWTGTWGSTHVYKCRCSGKGRGCYGAGAQTEGGSEIGLSQSCGIIAPALRGNSREGKRRVVGVEVGDLKMAGNGERFGKEVGKVKEGRDIREIK